MSGASAGKKGQQTVNMLISLLWMMGIISGWFLTQAVLYYDGNQPVNIIVALLILVCSQLVTLMILLVLTAGGLRGALRTLTIFNPASLLLNVVKKLNPERFESLRTTVLVASSPANTVIWQRLLVYLAQHFTVALNLGIVAALLYLVAVSDLAFGWNTTLTIEPTTVTQWFRIVALPWQSLVPAAVPDVELVEASRYYRLQGQLRTENWDAEQLGRWWIYILLCVVVYGLVPRLIALILSGYFYDRALVSAIAVSPGASLVLSRMRSPLVDTRGEHEEPEADHLESAALLSRRQSSQTLPCHIVEWAEARIEVRKLSALGIEPVKTFSAGGHQTLSEDQDTVQHIAAYHPKGIGIVVRSWESPMLEFLDFVRALRDQTGAACPIIILLIATAGNPVEPHQLESWETKLSSLSDPALYVEPT